MLSAFDKADTEILNEERQMKKKLYLTNISVFAMGAALFAGCSTTAPLWSKGKEIYAKGFTDRGNLYDIAPDARPWEFDIKGVIFVESKVVVDRAGRRNGSDITYDMLIKEAIKLGGNDFINLRVEEIENSETEDTLSNNGRNFFGRKYRPKGYIYKASALAIKYTKPAVSQPVKFESTATVIKK
jgi:hypothetical protein